MSNQHTVYTLKTGLLLATLLCLSQAGKTANHGHDVLSGSMHPPYQPHKLSLNP